MSFLDTVRCAIQKHAMLRPRDRLLVAVSGGPDSLALLVALVALRGELELHLEAAYVDHGLRPLQVRREISLVRKMGELFGVPVHILRRHVKRHSGESLEAKARSIRYEALAQCARKRKLSTLAVGHTQDDQAETVLLWLLRGTGMAGLAGIPPVREVPGILGARHRFRIIRPLLDVSRREIEAFLRDHRLKACEDSSNRSIKFTRNRIRRDLIPLLERQYNPKLRQHLGQLAQVLRDDFNYLKSQWQKDFRETARIGKRGLRLDRKKLARYPASARLGILRLGVARLQGDLTGFAQSHWSSLERMLTNGSASTLDLPHRFRAERQGERWILLSRSGTL